MCGFLDTDGDLRYNGSQSKKSVVYNVVFVCVSMRVSFSILFHFHFTHKQINSSTKVTNNLSCQLNPFILLFWLGGESLYIFIVF